MNVKNHHQFSKLRDSATLRFPCVKHAYPEYFSLHSNKLPSLLSLLNNSIIHTSHDLLPSALITCWLRQYGENVTGQFQSRNVTDLLTSIQLLLSVIINLNLSAACSWLSLWLLGLWLVMLTFRMPFELYCNELYWCYWLHYITFQHSCSVYDWFAPVFHGISWVFKEHVEWEICIDWLEILSVTDIRLVFYWKVFFLSQVKSYYYVCRTCWNLSASCK